MATGQVKIKVYLLNIYIYIYIIKYVILLTYHIYLFSYSVAAVLAFLLVVGIIWLIRRYMARDRGDYETNEAKGAGRFGNADVAVVFGKTGQPTVPNNKEYFI